jgi:hypothetical protein
LNQVGGAVLADLDLERVAKDAIAAGLFATDLDAVRGNNGVASRYERMPSTLLNVPYVNGPAFIEIFGRDVTEAAVLAVRRNFTEVNRLLLPKEQVLRYFHQRFVADDIFNSEHVARIVAEYRAPAAAEADPRVQKFFRRQLFAAGELDIADVIGTPHQHQPAADAERNASRFQSPELSFQVRGVERRSHVRALYTREEQIAALQLARERPSVVLAIIAYQSVIQDYLAALRETFDAIARESAAVRDGLKDFDRYIKEWASPNFTVELIPALAIFLRVREDSSEDAKQGSAIDAELFRDSVNFIVTNGAFRHWITIPADVAREHEAHVDHFLCPAVGTIREQTMDGSLLDALHRAVEEKANVGDARVIAFLEKIQAEASTKLTESERTPTEEDIARLHERVTMGIHYQGRDYSVSLDAPGFQEVFAGTPGRNDVVITPPLGSWFYDVLREAIAATLDRKTAVFFQFNGRGYRFTPGRLVDFLRRT